MYPWLLVNSSKLYTFTCICLKACKFCLSLRIEPTAWAQGGGGLLLWDRRETCPSPGPFPNERLKSSAMGMAGWHRRGGTVVRLYMSSQLQSWEHISQDDPLDAIGTIDISFKYNVTYNKNSINMISLLNHLVLWDWWEGNGRQCIQIVIPNSSNWVRYN